MYTRLRDECGFLCFFSASRKTVLVTINALLFWSPHPLRPRGRLSNFEHFYVAYTIYRIVCTVQSDDHFEGISFKVCTLFFGTLSSLRTVRILKIFAAFRINTYGPGIDFVRLFFSQPSVWAASPPIL